MAKLVRVEKQITNALMIVKKYVKLTTGRAASQEEIANTLKCYFILNEIGNQIRYQRKKAASGEEVRQNNQKDPFWTMNLISNSHQSNLAKAGLFSECIEEGIQSTQDFIIKTTGQKPSQEELAESLMCSFILSEIKNQIDWQRKNPEKAAGSDPTP
ncbi:MAG: hypothetical protein PVF79_04500 [Desulfobacterales bacterium]